MTQQKIRELKYSPPIDSVTPQQPLGAIHQVRQSVTPKPVPDRHVTEWMEGEMASWQSATRQTQKSAF